MQCALRRIQDDRLHTSVPFERRRHSELTELLPRADIIIVAMSQNPTNINMVNERFLSRCKSDPTCT